MYLDELYSLVGYINKRIINNYQIELALIQNPYTKNPKELWQILKSMQDIQPKEEQLDVVGMEILKQRLSGSSKILVKD